VPGHRALPPLPGRSIGAHKLPASPGRDHDRSSSTRTRPWLRNRPAGDTGAGLPRPWLAAPPFRSLASRRVCHTRGSVPWSLAPSPERHAPWPVPSPCASAPLAQMGVGPCDPATRPQAPGGASGIRGRASAMGRQWLSLPIARKIGSRLLSFAPDTRSGRFRGP
jgi:hypothetical protein